MYRRIISLFLLSFSWGCASTNLTQIRPDVTTIDIPALNIVQTAEIGDTLVSKGKIYTYKAIDLRNEVSSGDGFLAYKITVPAQKLVAEQEDTKWIYYHGKNVTGYDAMLGNQLIQGGLKVPKEGAQTQKREAESRRIKTPQIGPGIKIWGLTHDTTRTPKPEAIVDYIEIEALNEPGFKQELIYNGRTGNQVKFLYRELSQSMMRAPFSQEVQYDLNESNTIGFKGSRIEIVEASNTQLKYKVLNSFPDPE